MSCVLLVDADRERDAAVIARELTEASDIAGRGEARVQLRPLFDQVDTGEHSEKPVNGRTHVFATARRLEQAARARSGQHHAPRVARQRAIRARRGRRPRTGRPCRAGRVREGNGRAHPQPDDQASTTRSAARQCAIVAEDHPVLQQTRDDPAVTGDLLLVDEVRDADGPKYPCGSSASRGWRRSSSVHAVRIADVPGRREAGCGEQQPSRDVARPFTRATLGDDIAPWRSRRGRAARSMRRASDPR